MRLIDSHCHIHDTEFFGDQREAIYSRAVEAGIGMITVGTSVRSSEEAVKFANSHDLVWAAVGVHPHEAKDGWDEIRQLAGLGGRVVAIGEIGLDYYYQHSPRRAQIDCLEAQLQVAMDYNLPVSFHVRDAFDDFWPVFDNFTGIRGVLHCFTDNQANAERGLSRGLYIGINGISTFTKDKAQLQLYKTLPLERIIIETDAPYLTPAPFRGKMNEVGYVELVSNHQASQRGISLDEVARVTTHNTRQLFNI